MKRQAGAERLFGMWTSETKWCERDIACSKACKEMYLLKTQQTFDWEAESCYLVDILEMQVNL